MIRMDGKHQTRDEQEVRIYAVDGAEPHSVHGARHDENGWYYSGWTSYGDYTSEAEFPSPHDLIEIKLAAIDRMIAYLEEQVQKALGVGYTQITVIHTDAYEALTEARRIKAEAEKEG